MEEQLLLWQYCQPAISSLVNAVGQGVEMVLSTPLVTSEWENAGGQVEVEVLLEKVAGVEHY